MSSITILTATYNHPEKLLLLYRSLMRQTDSQFTWSVVNDGSEKTTDDVLSKCMLEEHAFSIKIINQVNAGKGNAINRGLDNLPTSTAFVLIVDDDEELLPDAIATLRIYYQRYQHANCGAIHFNRMNEHGELIARNLPHQDIMMSYQKFKALGKFSDGYIGYFTDKLAHTRFSIYEGEKYIGPSTLLMKITQKYKVLWTTAVLGKTEYLEGGITKQGRRLRLKNPRGMIEYCRFMQHPDAGIKNRFLYSMQAFAYRDFVPKQIRVHLDMSPFIGCTKWFGLLLAIYWRKKYL